MKRLKGIVCLAIVLATFIVFSGVAFAYGSSPYNVSITTYNDKTKYMKKQSEQHFQDDNDGCISGNSAGLRYQSYFTDGSTRVSAKHSIYGGQMWIETNDYVGWCHLILNNAHYGSTTTLEIYGKAVIW